MKNDSTRGFTVKQATFVQERCTLAMVGEMSLDVTVRTAAQESHVRFLQLILIRKEVPIKRKFDIARLKDGSR